MDRNDSAPDDQRPEDEETPAEEVQEEEEGADEEAGGDDVEVINGHAVGFAFLRHYREHPEIGLPVAEQVGDDQEFQHAILHWNGSDVDVTWREYQPDSHDVDTTATGGDSWSRSSGETSTPSSIATSSGARQEPEKRPWWKFW